MIYVEAIQFLYGLQMFGANFGLETTRKLAALAGNPQEKLCFIHVAGTNGKGSVCAMLESIIARQDSASDFSRRRILFLFENGFRSIAN